MHHVAGFLDFFHHWGGLGAGEIGVGGGGYQGFEGLPVALLQGQTDGGGADGGILGAEARDDVARDAGFGQLPGHDLVIQARDLAGGLLSDVAGGDVQGLGDFGEDRQVQLGVASMTAVSSFRK